MILWQKVVNNQNLKKEKAFIRYCRFFKVYLAFHYDYKRDRFIFNFLNEMNVANFQIVK